MVLLVMLQSARPEPLNMTSSPAIGALLRVQQEVLVKLRLKLQAQLP